MRRALEYAAGLGVTLAQHCEVTALSEGTCMHEGEWSARLGLAGQPSEAEELMVMRDIALGRLTGRAGALPAPLDRRVGGDDRRGQGGRAAGHRRGGTAPLHPHRRRVRRLRRDLQGAPTAADRRGRRCSRSRDSRTGPSTPSRPTTRLTPPRTRSARSTRRRPGMLGLEYALALAFTRARRRRPDDDRGGRHRPDVVGPGGHRGHGGARTHRSRPVRRRTCASSTRRFAGRSMRPAGHHAVGTCPTWAARCGAGCATRCSPAKPS